MTTPISGTVFVRRLGLTCNEDMKDNAKIICKNSRLEPRIGGCEVTHRVHLIMWLYGKRTIDFLLVTIQLFFASSHV